MYRRLRILIIGVCVCGVLSGGVGGVARAATATGGWQTVPEARTTASNRTIQGVAVVAVGNVWAVGWENAVVPARGMRPTPIISHYDGANWTRQPNPTPGDRAAYLYAVAALAANDIWAVGAIAPNSDERSYDMTPLILHYDGSQWATVPAADTTAQGKRVFLTSLAAVAPDDVWAVGNAGDSGVVQHWNGRAWLPVAVPSASGVVREQIRWRSVSAASAGDVWIVGERSLSQAGKGGTQPVAAHYNGVGWVLVNTPLPPGISNTLESITARTGDDVWAVGAVGTPPDYPNPSPGQRVVPFLIHWDGAMWREVAVPLPDPAATSTRLDAVLALAPDDVWVGGTYGNRVTVGDVITDSAAAFTLHWDGAAWAVVPAPRATGTTYPAFDSVNALVAVSPAEVWCGGRFVGGGVMLLRYTG